MDKVIAFLGLLLILPAVYAQTSHIVGDANGWTLGVDYSTWVSGQTFTVGDTLVFNYGTNHAVDEVTQANYGSCNSANPISTNPNNPTTIPLTAPGTRYFICPRGNHCSQGMLLTVNVVAAGATSPPSPTPPTGTTPPSTGSPTETPPSPTPPLVQAPPPPSAATTVLNGRNSLIAGFSLLALVFGIMG